ncbi:MAG: M16 family metallopeptidase [Alphaproteobacteria bacterium]
MAILARRKSLLFSLALTISVGGTACAAPKAAVQPDLARTPSLDALIETYQFKPHSFTLKNGMDVVLVEDHRAPVVTHMVWYRTGAADEVQGKSGIAHFLEHLLFKGTEKVPPGEFSKIVARNGGQDNAFTSWDYTGYFQRVSADRLDLVMGLEADRMRNLVLTDDVVLPERDVILEERSSRTDNRASARLGEEMAALLYRHHPYGRPIIGWRHEIKQLGLQDALDFYERYYAPDNAILVVSGAVTPAALKALAQKHYGGLKPSAAPRVDRVAEPPQRAPRRVELRDAQVGASQLRRQYAVPSFRSADNVSEAAALDVLVDILGGGPSSRLYQALVVEGGQATSAWAYYQGMLRDDGFLALGGTARADMSINDLETAMDAELEKLVADGVSDDEVLQAKLRLMAGAIQMLDSSESLARMVGGAVAAGYDLDFVLGWPKLLQAVTKEDVQAAAAKWLKVERSVTGLLLPAKGEGEK